MRRPFALQKNILDFYSNASAPIDTKKDPGKWQKVQNNLEALKTFTPNPAHPAAPQAQSTTQAPTGGHAVATLLRK